MGRLNEDDGCNFRAAYLHCALFFDVVEGKSKGGRAAKQEQEQSSKGELMVKNETGERL